MTPEEIHQLRAKITYREWLAVAAAAWDEGFQVGEQRGQGKYWMSNPYRETT